MNSAWVHALDAIERDLEAIEAALETDDPPAERPNPTIPGEPIPAELGARAEALLARSRSLQARAVGDMDGIQAGLRALTGRPPRPQLPTGGNVDIDA